MNDAVATKATATISKRSGSCIAYLVAKAQKEEEPFPLTELGAYSYMDCLRYEGCAASKPMAFLEAVGFAKGTLGLMRTDAVRSSVRVKGLASADLRTMGPQVKRDPFTSEVLGRMESVVAAAGEDDAEDGWDDQSRCFVGFLLFCLHTRSRFADAARVKVEPSLDLGPDGEGFIESVTVGSQVKSGQTNKKARMSLPLVGLAGGSPEARGLRPGLPCGSRSASTPPLTDA